MDNTINLNITDLQMTVNFIDLMAERGNIRGDELLPIGLLRQKYSNFVEQSQKNVKDAEQIDTNTNQNIGENNNG